MEKAIMIQLVLGLVIGGALGALLGHFGKCSTGTCPLTANPLRGAIYGMIMGAVFSLTVPMSKHGADASLPPGTAQAAETESVVGSSIHHVTSTADFEDQVLQAELPVLVDFYSDSCPPCRMLGPTIEKLATSYAGRALVYKVNVDRLPNLARRYGISGIPAVLFFVHGQERNRLVGLRPERAYASALDKLIN